MRKWLFGILFGLIGCVAKHPTIPTGQHNFNEFYPPEFTRVVAKGKFNLTLHTRALRSRMTVQGDSRDLAQLKWAVKNKVLYIELKKKYPKYGMVDIQVYTQKLVGLIYKGNGKIMGQNLRTQQLDLEIENNNATYLAGNLNLHRLVLGGSGHYHLRGGQSRWMSLRMQGKAKAEIVGVANVTTIDMANQSWLSLYWLNSQKLQLTLKDSARAQIAGVASLALINLKGHAWFNGRYLRINEAFVKTQGSSRADIAVVKTQHSLAVDQSNIYYYALPTYRTDFMGNNGSVLDFKAWESF